MLSLRRRLAALVYTAGDDPDTILSDFAVDLNSRGFRVVGMVQTGACADSTLSAVLVHNSETLPLAQDHDSNLKGCRLEISRLENAGARIADAIADGADLVIINRFGKREQKGEGLAYLVETAFGAGIPVITAVATQRLDDWIKFTNGTGETLPCQRNALEAWWRNLSTQ